MLQAPATESKERSEARRTAAEREPQQELHPQSLSVGSFGRAPGRGLSGADQLRQHAAGLQRTVGNQAVLRMLGHPPQMPAPVPSHGRPVLQRMCACGGSEGECDACKEKKEEGILQREATGPSASSEVPPIVGESLRSPGRPLDATTRAFFEPRFSADFSSVRVHTESRPAQSALAVRASAYTVGQHVVFAPGRYDPHSQSGQKLLAHELTHVLQQRGSPDSTVTNSPSSGALRIDASGESAAERAAASVMAGSAPAPLGAPRGPAVQRQELLIPEGGLAPEFGPEFGPELGPEFAPELGPEFGGPEFQPEIDLDPEIAPELEAPEGLPESGTETPETVPEPESVPESETAPAEDARPGPFPVPPVAPQPQPHPPDDEEPEPDCGSPDMPLTNVSFYPGPMGQGGRVKASPLTKCPGNTVGTEPDNRIYRRQFDCIRAAGQLGRWVRAHILHGRTSSSGPINLHGPGDDMRNLIIASQRMNRRMRTRVEGPVLNRVYGGNQVLWYESKVNSYVPGLDYFAQSMTVDFGSFNPKTGTEGPSLIGGPVPFPLEQPAPNCPSLASFPTPTPSQPAVTPPSGGSSSASSNRSSLLFESSVQICLKELKSRVFHVANGGVDLRIETQWFNSAGDEVQTSQRCPIRDFGVTLVKNNILFNDTVSTSRLRIGQGARLRWKHLPEGDYFFKFTTANNDSTCCLQGDMSVGTFSAPRPPRPPHPLKPQYPIA
jgi:hypothetical protein